MFTEFASGCAWENQSHRGWTTLASFALQGFLLSVLLLLPLLYTQALPHLHLMETGILSPPPGPPPATAQARRANPSPSNLIGHILMMPSRIPNAIATLHEDEVLPTPELGDGSLVAGGTGPAGARNPVLDGLGNGPGVIPPPPRAPSAPSPPVSHMMEGNLLLRVQPVYPPLAREARIQGSVVLQAVIDRDGKIKNLQVLSGHPMLVQAAVDAVRRWRYRPYVLNEQPIEVETQITVKFTLEGGG
jgi:periplasmic protein TonB